MFKKGNYRDILFDFSSIINIQNALLNDPSLTKKRYLEILEYRKMKTMNPNEIKELDREIDILNRMELLLSPSPVSSLSKTKSKTKAKKSRKLTKTKKVINCPEGSKINPKTGRCNKIKVYPPCPPTRDPITHRCKRIIE
jgi:hypothetical protein